MGMHIANMDEAQKLIRDANAREDALRKEVARLRAALKPFADLARTYKVETVEFNRPDNTPLFGLNDARLTVGDMRAALKALE